MKNVQEAVSEIDTPAENAALLIVEPTEIDQLHFKDDPKELAQMYYKLERGYDGPMHAVSEGPEADGSYRVMVIQEEADGNTSGTNEIATVRIYADMTGEEIEEKEDIPEGEYVYSVVEGQLYLSDGG